MGKITFEGDSGREYVVVRQIGSGGFGTVYEAYEKLSGLRVAIKMIRVKEGQRTNHEVVILGGCGDGKVPLLFDQGTLGNLSFAVMELCDGDLYEILDNGTITEFETAFLAIRLIEAVLHTHERNVTHRDIKPQNIFFSQLRCVNGVRIYALKLGDFGIVYCGT
uniref:non-specific serine/threonine protein kinase n=1 Tax=Chromera velia CCMP2878 TaxID=1169474 RepID=A0A0G4GPM2_9ALVE|eukprot:Cvel_22824.t1-p1 / transcript=Cvel_22824.t1 / gene=Cvel_22824 / organism=Chromera_velia_CCMP2878 / gene_product=Calcium-dependent protein kinase 2, putative / transcript_product=Calcium-dependent protein kinase 2, putative / location=Cvel_scaffold2286:1560-2048(-) / protein_length=163 / sequence_SO=supercontig / SO=protein_coding / is_pseudo=false